MKAKKLIPAILLVLGLISAALSSNSGSDVNNTSSINWKKSDTTDNGGGGPVPPIGR